ncbi:MAG: ABC transporter ATP-binding protein [Planctomycetes bacterium]|nr:ABC transporter ATP-binding protein [Planctomycetota bacterium]
MNDFFVARGIVKNFSMDSTELRVLKGIDLDIPKGEILSIAGPSGAGKSTLLHVLGLIEQATSGTITFQGREISAKNRGRAGSLRNISFGFVFQFYHLIPELNVLENVLLPKMIGSPFFTWPFRKIAYKRQAEAMLEKVGMKDRLLHKPSELSGGERQRVAIARAVINNPDILFCDEPTGNLDVKTSEEIINILWELNKVFGMTIIMVTHDLNIAAKAHRQVRMVDGLLSL